MNAGSGYYDEDGNWVGDTDPPLDATDPLAGGGNMSPAFPDASPTPLDNSPWLPPLDSTDPLGSNLSPSTAPQVGSSGVQTPGFFDRLGSNLSGPNSNAPGAAAGALNSLQKQLQSNANNKTQRMGAQVTESRLNPARFLLDQAKSAGSLDLMANNDFSSKPTTIAGRYGTVAGPAASGFTWNPSPQTRGTAAAALALVRGGQGTAPSVTGIPTPPQVQNAPGYLPPALLKKQQLAAAAAAASGNPWLQDPAYGT